jgi:aspartate racemase
LIQLKKIGLIGGIGPESTIDYYKEIISAFNTHYKDLAYPEIFIYSANLNELMKIVEAKAWSQLITWLLEKIHVLHRAGAEFAAIASNTPHIVFNEISSKSPIPLLSIVEETCKKAQKMKLKKIGLMGTKLTMESNFYKEQFISKGISIVVPKDKEQQLIHHKLFSEIELGIIREETRDKFLAIMKRMVIENKIDSLILGCTELPLILKDSCHGIPFLNTTAIHCKSIVTYCTS